MQEEQKSVIAAIERAFAYLGSGAASDPGAVFCAGFRAFENGVQMSGDELIALMRKVHQEGRRYQWSVTEPQVEIQGDLAVVVHVNRGSITERPGLAASAACWLETIVLRREQLGWRIAFIHATRTKD